MTTPLTESERATLELAPGSRWEGDQVVDEDDVRTTVTLRERATSWVNIEQYGTDVVAFVPDVLAVIRAAGLDPVWPNREQRRKQWRSTSRKSRAKRHA